MYIDFGDVIAGERDYPNTLLLFNVSEYEKYSMLYMVVYLLILHSDQLTYLDTGNHENTTAMSLYWVQSNTFNRY